MTAEFNAGSWASDGLLAWVLSNLGTFWWQSHTLTHLARDDLGQNDCDNEDGGKGICVTLNPPFFFTQISKW